MLVPVYVVNLNNVLTYDRYKRYVAKKQDVQLKSKQHLVSIQILIDQRKTYMSLRC